MRRKLFIPIMASVSLLVPAGNLHGQIVSTEPSGPLLAQAKSPQSLHPMTQQTPGTPSPKDAAATTGLDSGEEKSESKVDPTAEEISSVAVDPAANSEAEQLPAEPSEWKIAPYASAEEPALAAASDTANAAAGTSGGTESADDPIASMGRVVTDLIGKMAERGVISAEEASQAKNQVAKAEAQARVQKVQTESDMFAIAQIAAVQTLSSQAANQQQGMSAVEASRQEMMASTGVTYIPLPVREQITEDIRRELGMTVGGSTEQKPPPGLPALLARLRPEGEIRFRYEADLYPENNDATGAFPNFNAINTAGSPYNTGLNNPDLAPQWNTDQNRNRYRMLIRLGSGIDLGDNVSAGIRLASGENNSPTTANQSMGLANQGQGGQFSKYAIWIERAYLRYDLGGDMNDAALTLWVGRFDNPFFSTGLMFDNDLGFDGAAARLSYNYEDIVTPSIVAGAFPVFNTDLNFSSNNAQKYPSYDKYLLAVQTGTKINLAKNWSTELAAAYYDFINVEGQLSSPYVPLSASDAGDTDNSRPSFAQKGNTYRPLRNITPSPLNNFGTINQWQYYGLATPFRNLTLTGRLDYDGFEPVRVSLIGEFVQNLAFNSGAIDEVAINNRGDAVAPSGLGTFEGSGTGWLVDLMVGHEKLDQRGAWQLSFGYRWIGSDSVVDGFNDSDFGMGGTNMKGFTVAGRLALTPHLYLGARWFGSESIAGPQFDMNIFQLDIGAKF